MHQGGAGRSRSHTPTPALPYSRTFPSRLPSGVGLAEELAGAGGAGGAGASVVAFESAMVALGAGGADVSVLLPAASPQRPQVRAQKGAMKASPHLPHAFCWAQLYEGGGRSSQRAAPVAADGAGRAAGAAEAGRQASGLEQSRPRALHRLKGSQWASAAAVRRLSDRQHNRALTLPCCPSYLAYSASQRQ